VRALWKGSNFAWRVNPRMRQATHQLKSIVFEICGKKCARCGFAVATIDHVLPYSYGGQTIPSNLQPLCSACNNAKRDRNAVDYRSAEMRQRLQEWD